jgi:hypothetical protein
MDKEIIQNMYHYYDSHIDKYYKYFEGDISIETKISNNDIEFSKLILYKNGKKLLSASYSILGKYHHNDNIWIWGWSLPIKKNQNFFIKKIFDYGYNIVENNDTTILIKELLVNSVFKINNIEFILALSLFITKNEHIYRSYDKNNNSDFYLLKDIEIF